MDADPELHVTLSDGRQTATYAILPSEDATDRYWTVVEPGVLHHAVTTLAHALAARARLDHRVAGRLATGWVPVEHQAPAVPVPLPATVVAVMGPLLTAVACARTALQAADPSGRLWAAAYLLRRHAQRCGVHAGPPPRGGVARRRGHRAAPAGDPAPGEAAPPRAGAAPPVASSALSADTSKSMASALIRRDPALMQIYAARQALEKASTIPEVKAIKDLADVAEIYAKRRQLGEEAEALAHTVKMLALEKLGRLITTAKADGTLNQGTRGHGRPPKGRSRPVRPNDPRPTLRDLGLTRKTSMQAQQLAALPAKAREAVITHRQSLPRAVAAARAGKKMPTNVETRSGSRDPLAVKAETTTWLDSFSVARHVDPTFLTKMTALRAHFGGKTPTATVLALVNFAYAAITDAATR